MTTLPEALNLDFFENQYRQWQNDPASVPKDWHFFFQGFNMAESRDAVVAVSDDAFVHRQCRVDALIHRYRELGHLLSCLDPMEACPIDHPLLELAAFDLNPDDLNQPFYTNGLLDRPRALLGDIVNHLKKTYCSAIGVEYMHMQDPVERQWLQARMETVANAPDLNATTLQRAWQKLCEATLFERFLNKKYPGQTRFSLEGGECIIPLLDTLVHHASDHGSQEIVLGMAHRGRLNIQAHVFKKPYQDIFAEFEHCHDPSSLFGAGDVKYHNGFLSDLRLSNGRAMRIVLAYNPSHLESVNPVVEGMVRGRQDLHDGDTLTQVMPVLIHGDAAFAGQGIVAETLNMSQLQGYRTGGTVHIIINNQIGYTTLPEDARSTRYSTDVAKMLAIPVFHVHGEDPEAVLHVTQLACDYRMAFNKDVVIDLICYRRYGHNEGDEPYFTQPLMYERIRQRPSVYDLFSERMIDRGVIGKTDVNRAEQDINDLLEGEHYRVVNEACPFPVIRFFEEWESFHGHYSHDPVETGVERQSLLDLIHKLNQVPEGFHLFGKLQKLLQKRVDSVIQGTALDWATAETLAFASLVVEGYPVRLSGQDSGRGTFSQRHAVLNDTKSGEQFTPLNHLSEHQARFEVYNSLLSEAGVLGFEYGYSQALPSALVMWEAQFGDFVNNAQTIVDLYLISGESKWQRLSGLVLLLPHGMEGLGPEHSSARPERLLQLCAGDNIQICNVTTPAQYFHLLRRQVIRRVRKPLFVLTPKSLLRHPMAVSPLADLVSDHLREVLDDPLSPNAPRRVFFCSGKIFYELYRRRQALQRDDVALVRLEQIYPFPRDLIEVVINRYAGARQWGWVQEEPANMGAASFIIPRLETLIGSPVRYIGRPATSSPATGFPKVYKKEQEDIVEEAIGPGK